MATTNLKQFDAAVHKTNEWIRDLMKLLDSEDRNGAYHGFRAVLHALRDRLTIEEAVDLAAQLPMLVRGFYYEGWQPAHVPVRDRTTEDFLQHVRDAYPGDAWVDVEQITRAVFRLLASRVSSGEIEDIMHCLPQELRELWN